MLFALPGVPRSAAAKAAMARRYRSTDSLPAVGIDALIVTGTEPLAADLRQEPFWDEMAALTDWAAANTASTVFSCLAAHAAVLHEAGVERRPMGRKLSGVFDVEAAAHALTQGQDRPLATPHSRWNDLDEGELLDAGYQVLTRSNSTGADAFIRDGESLFLFLQGHPEYEADTLMLEYRRDLRRFLLGERPRHPDLPTGYFAPEVEAALNTLAEDTVRRPSLSALSDCARIVRQGPPAARWAKTTRQLYRNWLALVAERVEGTVSAR
jgi:homoserine O-succinyltransferase